MWFINLAYPLEELKKEIEDADALIIRSGTKVTKEIIATMPKDLRSLVEQEPGLITLMWQKLPKRVS
jgi:phosphoglycerate dehydrogenase-like enzyme